MFVRSGAERLSRCVRPSRGLTLPGLSQLCGYLTTSHPRLFDEKTAPPKPRVMGTRVFDSETCHKNGDLKTWYWRSDDNPRTVRLDQTPNMQFKKVRDLDPDFIKLVVPLLPPRNAAPGGPIDIGKARTGMAAMTRGKERALNGPWKHLLDKVTTYNIHISMRDGHQAELRIIKPKEASDSLPVLFSMHGGGFIGGDNDTEELINRQLALECQLVIFSIDYRLAPEHKVTTTIFEDCEDAAKWTVAHASEHGGDISKGFFIGGTSVGAMMTATLSFRAPALGLPVKGMLLRQGAFISGDSAKEEWKPRLKSWEENADSPLLGSKEAEKITKIMDIPKEHSIDPWYFPVHATRQELSRMPRAYFVAAGCDPIVDDVMLFRELLTDAGVETKLTMYEGMPHGFHAFHDLKQARAEMKETAEGVAWLVKSTKA